MMIYPSLLPCPSRIGHGAQASAGLVRTPMNSGNSRQRRAYRNLPHCISLTFDMPQTDYAAWLAWVNAYAWDEWVLMRLPGLEASRADAETALIAVRFCTDLQSELEPVHRLWWWRVRVDAEYLPTLEQLALIAIGDWIVAGSPAAAAPDWIVAGIPAAPAADVVSAGTALAPAATV